jgi:hypothetical protein
MGSTPIQATEIGQVVEQKTHGAQNPALLTGRESANLSLVTACRWGRCPIGFHKAAGPARYRDLQLLWCGWTSVRRRLIPAATWCDSMTRDCNWPGTLTGKAVRLRAWRLGVQIPPRLLEIGPVVQRRRHLGHIQGMMVRVHPGSLEGLQVLREHSSLVWRRAGFDSRVNLWGGTRAPAVNRGPMTGGE